MIKRWMAVLVLVSMLGAGTARAQENPPAPGFDAAGSDARAMALADRTMQAMGGRRHWDAVQCLGWTIFGRTHLWNKWTGDYRLEADTLLVIMNVNTGEGRAWTKGKAMPSGSALDEVLGTARSIWINDMYWFLMPYKLKDSGVTLTYTGERDTEDGRLADVLTLTFKGVGDTPQNRYEVCIDRETGLVSQWSYFADRADAEPRFTLPWTDWKAYDGIKLAAGHGRERAQVSGIRVSAGDERAAFAGP